jgi:hypothetical protein
MKQSISIKSRQHIGKIANIIAIVLVTQAFLLVACSKNETAKDSKAKPANESAAQPTNQDKSVASNPPGIPDPGQTNAAGSATENAATPPYIKKTIDHFKNVTTLMKENISDCKMVVDAISRYIEENKIDIENAIKDGDEAQAKMTSQVKTIFLLQVKELFNPIMQEVGNVSTEFAKKCRSDVKQLSELLKSLGSRTSGL